MAKRKKAHQDVLPLFDEASHDVPKERLRRSYSADLIMSGKVRDVIPIAGKHYVCTGVSSYARKPNGCRNEVYYLHEVVTLELYPGKAVKYGEARCGDRLSYLGVTVKHGKSVWVMVSDDASIEINVLDAVNDLVDSD